jgi:hypothetical protein
MLPNMVDLISQSQTRTYAATGLFGAARAVAQERGLVAAVLRRPNTLPTLAQDYPNAKAVRYAGRRSVRLDDIRGTEGRAQGFDAKFYPVNDETRQRWQSVASAVDEGVALPPVQLIQVGADYYVRDGHHRVSVGRALGQEVIEAEVTVWEP